MSILDRRARNHQRSATSQLVLFRRWPRTLSAISLLLSAVLLAACQGDAPAAVEVPGGDPDTGRELIMSYDCGECHRIPGVDGAEGRIAPGLQVWPNRALVVNTIPNTPENVMRFIQDPQDVLAGTAMPDLGVSEAEARHITAYLFTLGQ